MHKAADNSEARACITGRGVMVAGGSSIASFWRSAVAGVVTAARSPNLDGLDVDIAHQVDTDAISSILGARISRRADRFVQLGLAAAFAAVEESGVLDHVDPSRVGVIMGNSLGGAATVRTLQQTLEADGESFVSPMSLPASINNMLAGCIALRLGLHGTSFVVSTACASGTDAIGMARTMVESGTLDAVVAGGSEAPIVPPVMAAFTRMGAVSRRTEPAVDANKPFSQNRSGFTLGEGSGVVVVERLADAHRRGREPYVVISGYGSTNDASHETSPHSTGQWYEAAVMQALTGAGTTARQTDYWNMHGTGTSLNDIAEAHVASRLVGDSVPIGSTKPLTGHCLGATGAIEAILCSLAITEGLIPPSVNSAPVDPELPVLDIADTARTTSVERVLTTSLGFGGHNAALVLEAV